MPAPKDLRLRAVIEHVRPSVDCGALPAKAAVGQPLLVSADICADGHDLLAAVVRHRASVDAAPPSRADSAASTAGRRGAASAEVAEIPMEPLGNDRFSALIVPSCVGPWEFEIVAMPDDYGSWLRDLGRRQEAGQELGVELEVGALLAEGRLARRQPRQDSADLGELAARLRDPARPERARVELAGSSSAVALLRRSADWRTATRSGPWRLFVDRERAVFSAWYELFPRSEGARPPRSGTLRSAARRLPAIAAMGFDTVYLPPIHPIGRTNRKGKNNALTASPDDVGTPWAIGAEEGGHTAVHPDLGELDDFVAFREEAESNGLEVALDFAIQCSPDHPWVRSHPQWFRHRPDGSIRYAENPPKRYQDVYPLDFETEDIEALERELIGVVRFWVDKGVRVFRVDNPHTKSLRFWQRLIGEIQRRDPGVQFLSEAFTRPRVMERLAKYGFTQSYTYFTWRNTKEELASYLTELSQTELCDWFRPNFWVNTPDILHETLQRGGAPAFRLRAVLAALCCPSWGVYSGYELNESTPLREGSEEYLDSEKYQLRPRDWNRPDSLVPLLTRLNAIRRSHRAALSQLRTLRVHHVDGDQLLCVSRMDDARSDILLVIVNLDPFGAHEGLTWLDLEALGIPAEQPFEAFDELSQTSFLWTGPSNYVRLDPAAEQPAHALHLRPH